MKESWYARKVIGNYRFPRNHPDVKRDRLNEKGMKRLRKLKDRPDYETYLTAVSRAQILLWTILMPWKWKLCLISPTSKNSKGCKGEVDCWQFMAEERYGRIRHLVLQRNVERDIWRTK